MRIVSLLALAALAAPAAASAQATLATTQYDQDFDSLASTGTSTTLPEGFRILEIGSNANTTYAANSGSSNAGNTYSYGVNGSTERALGSLGSGSITTAYYGGFFVNGTGGEIESLTFSYDGEQWRAGNSTDDLLNFQFSLDATGLDNGTWTDLNSLDFAALVLSGNAALDGNLAANRVTLNGTIGGLSIANGGSFAFRWVDVNSGGNDHGLAVDNLSINATLAQAGAVPEPSAWTLLILGFGVVGGALRRRRSFAFA